MRVLCGSSNNKTGREKESEKEEEEEEEIIIKYSVNILYGFTVIPWTYFYHTNEKLLDRRITARARACSS